MRIFANLFLILFVADGGFSLFDEVVSLFYPLPALSEVRALLANVVILMAVTLYLCLGIDKRLPKRVFLPLVFFLFSCPVSSMLFPSISTKPAYGLFMALGQVLLSMLVIFRFPKKGEQSAMMPEAAFNAPFFSLRNTLLFGAANLVVIPLVLLLLTLGAANSYLEEHTAGFMRLAPDGLYMTERVYRRNNKTIRLAAMIHVGEKEYYNELAGSPASGRTIVLAEGVTDDKQLLRDKLDYGKVAGFLGLTSQGKMLYRGRLIGEGTLDEPAARARTGEEGETAGPVDILRADMDISSFRPQTIHFLNALGKQMEENDSTVKGLLSLNAWAQKNVTPEMQKIIMDDILSGRNKVLIRHLRKAVDRYDTIVIPWGALHMPEIEAEVLAQGFALQQERKRLSIDLKRILKDEL